MTTGQHLTVLYSVKGGSGTTVTAALTALQHPYDTVLVDLQGDLANAFGCPVSKLALDDYLFDPSLAGVSLDSLTIDLNDTTRLLPTGRPIDLAAVNRDQHASFEKWLDEQRGLVVIDAGTGVPYHTLVERADLTVAVGRPCYLGLMKAARPGYRPDGVVVVRESHRALRPSDIERVFNAPIVAIVDYDPAIARAVDAGLLTTRSDRGLAPSLARITTPTIPTTAIEQWRAADPARHSPDIDYGAGWRSRAHPHSRWRVSWNTGSGDLYAIDEDEQVIDLGHFAIRGQVDRAVGDWDRFHDRHDGLEILRGRCTPQSPLNGPSIA